MFKIFQKNIIIQNQLLGIESCTDTNKSSYLEKLYQGFNRKNIH